MARRTSNILQAVPRHDMSHSLNSLKGVISGITIGVIKGDTRSFNPTPFPGFGFPGGPCRALEAPGGSWRPLGPPQRPLEAPGGQARLRRAFKKYYRFKKTVIKLVFPFQFKYINGLKAVKILVDARKRRV